MDLRHLQIITASDGTGQNCHDRALAALTLCPTARAVIGSVMLRGGRDLRTGRALRWCKPWGHHIWLREQDGHYYDPSAQNLQLWAETEEIELPNHWRLMTAAVVESPASHAQIVNASMRDLPGPVDADLIYMPGLVFSTDLEERPAPHEYIHAWGRLANECRKAGGWTAAQLEQALERVEVLMAEKPQIRSEEVAITPTPRPTTNHRPRPAARGFAAGAVSAAIAQEVR